MSKLGFAITRFVALLASAGCSGNVSTSADHSVGGSTQASGGNAGSAGSIPSGTGGLSGIGGLTAGGTSGSANGPTGGGSGSGGVIEMGDRAGQGGNDYAAGAGGSSGAPQACGGPMSIKCPVGQLCDVETKCGTVPNVAGVCSALPKVGDCSEEEDPEGSSCGCDGKNYVNDCWRRAFGVPEASAGSCMSGGIASYPSAYGVWLAPRGDGGVGPAVVVAAADGSIRTWNSVVAFPPENPPPNPTSNKPLSRDDSDDIFLRFAGVLLDALPHQPGATSDCHPKFYFKLCETCAIRAVVYDSPGQVLPEMEAVWLSFDRILGASAAVNPRNFCK